MATKSRGNYTAAYAWGQGDKLTAVTSNFPGEGTVTYNCGSDGKRRERNNGTVTKYRWDEDWNVVSEEDEGGTLAATLVPGMADIGGSSPSIGAAYYPIDDSLDSVRALYDVNKTFRGTYEYDPYGSAYSQEGDTSTRQFTGLDLDKATNMYFAPYRYYVPSTARWITPDPIDLMNGRSLYGYVSGQPTALVDTMGLQSSLGRKFTHWGACMDGEDSCPVLGTLGRLAVVEGTLDWWGYMPFYKAGERFFGKISRGLFPLNRLLAKTRVQSSNPFSKLAWSTVGNWKTYKNLPGGVYTGGRLLPALGGLMTFTTLAQGAYDWTRMIACAVKASRMN
jgi:RHS repeat-associated protein